ncbi:hypothetical protein FB45DRAFT_1035371 [Roridomyces roridus]|uniref:Uncharacterized protein n=1 Tax=Roridomyces roridus TaxID=1738132 RepID=A0AAD7BA48_9AGAR|nr:hypothetical protein FB45DRAFT_1035371 [Roridomyces roridus]
MAHDEFQGFPPELERLLFETTALVHPGTIPALLRVAQRSLEWQVRSAALHISPPHRIEPFLYQTIKIFIFETSVTVAESGRILLERLETHRTGPAFFSSSIRALEIISFDWHIAGPPKKPAWSVNDLKRLLDVCAGAKIEHLLLFGELERRPLISLLTDKQICVPRLTLVTNLLRSPSVDFTLPMFRGLTHLALAEIDRVLIADGQEEEYSEVPEHNHWPAILALPSLTHLAVCPDHAPRSVESVLADLPQLQAMVIIPLAVDAAAAQQFVKQHIPSPGDERVVVIPFDGDGIMNAQGRYANRMDEMWTKVDGFVERKRRGEVGRFNARSYQIVCRVIFGILGLIESLYAFPGWQCSLLAFLINFNVLFSASIFFCVALNLMLVLVCNVNGRMMEKYYIIGSLVLAGACLGSAYAAGRLGLDTKYHICWYNNKNETGMLPWVIGTEMFWMLLLSAGELGVFLIIVAYLLPFTFNSNWTVARHSPDSESQTRGRTRLTIVTLRGIILRIGLYPLVSCLMNITGSLVTVYELREQADPVPSVASFRLFGIMVLSARPLVYSMMAATDPSFVRAIRARCVASVSESSSAAQRATQVPPSVCLTTIVDLTVESTQGTDWDHLGDGGHTQAEISSFNRTESTVGMSIKTQKAELMNKDIEAVGIVEPVVGPSSASEWDIVRHI